MNPEEISKEFRKRFPNAPSEEEMKKKLKEMIEFNKKYGHIFDGIF